MPGHPLLESVISLVNETYFHPLRQGAVMVDESDMSEELQAIFLVDMKFMTEERRVPVPVRPYEETAIRAAVAKW